ncbi:hypothetical protein [Kribbella soli]|uniref:Integrin beta subunit VWA domain-containing protein n=1 Tax=Kribbella soli TaxID=1124743 RepID=A0A4R0H144_9ACTN|nr:hypothetical protein [Kribbella soli]TCC01952.1 hypothetical protein E0H45_41550 [Kribbella soli]
MSSTAGGSSGGEIGPEPTEAVRVALVEALGTEEIDVVAGETGRMPDGQEVRAFYGVVRGEPNHGTSIAVDASGAVHPRRRLEALAGPGLFVPATAAPAAAPAVAAVEPVTVDPPTNTWVLPECVTEHETVTVQIPQSRIPPKADVYLLADTTFSMHDVISAVQSGIGAIVSDPAFAGFDLAWGAGNYKDFPVGPNPYAFQHQLAPTPGVADVNAAVAIWTASDGFDIPEGQLFALQQVATDPAIGWRTDSKRIVVWFGDAPGHDPVCSALSGVPDVTEGTATAALVAAGITLVAVSTNTGTADALDGDPTQFATDYGPCPVGGSAGQATRMTAATPGGTHTVGVDAAQIVNTLIPLINAAVHSIADVHLQPTGSIAQFVTSITPPSYGPLPGNTPHTLPFDVTWTGVVDCEEDEQTFTGTLDVIADGVVVATKPVTVTVPACRWHHSVEMICGTEKERDDCQTIVDGRYATAVTIYNPTTCAVTIVKYFAPLVLDGKPVGREPRTVRARPFAKLVLEPGTATMDDCCSLEEAIGHKGPDLDLGVLDIVADHPLEVTVTHTASGAGRAASSIDSRTIRPRMA